MSDQEQSVIQSLTEDIERLLPIGNWVKFLVAGGVAIGAWVTTIQVQARQAVDSTIEVKQTVSSVQAKVDDFIKAQAETNQRLARIEGRLETK